MARSQCSVVAVRIGQAITVAEAVLLGLWVVEPGVAVALGGAPSKPATCLAMLLVGVVIGWPALTRRVELVLLATAGAVAVEAVLSVALDRPLISSYVLFPQSWQDVTPDGTGQMAMPSALGLLLLTGGLAVGVSHRRATTALGITAFGLAYVSTLGHLYGVSELYTFQTATSMSLLTALALLVVAAAVVLCDDSLPVPCALRAPGTAGALVRTLVGWTLLLPPTVAWAVARAIGWGWVDAAFGLSVLALMSAVGGVLLVLAGALTAARSEAGREAVADDLEALNAVLFERVAAAVAEAEEDRERLATDQVEAAGRLSRSEQRYRSVVGAMAEGVVLRDGSGRIVTVNDAACRLLGRDEEQLVGMAAVDPRLRSLRDDGSELPLEEHPSALVLKTGHPVRDVTMGMHRPDGSLVWLTVSSQPLVGADSGSAGSGASSGVVTTFADVTAARAAAAALRRSEEQFRHAMALAPIGMALVELDGRFREVNRALARLVGYDESELMGLTFQQITHPDDLEADMNNVALLMDGSLDHFTMEKRYLTRSGGIVWVLLAVSLARDDEDRPSYFISQIQDITDTRAAQERLAHRALHDPLTGLPNRDLLMDHLSHTLARSAHSGTSTAVMFCDLDHFKAVNDTHGHEAGDLLLVTVADRLRAVMRPGDKVSRLGGDEFVVVAEGLPDPAAVRALAERVRRALDEPLQVDGHVVQTGVSIGIAIASARDDARSVLREADAAMYRAKALGRGRLELSPGAGAWGGQRVTDLHAVAEELDPRPA